MTEAAQEKAGHSYAWGPLSVLGLAVALVALIVDQASKLWLLHVFDLAARTRVALLPFLDLVITWNTGISYGLFQQQGAIGFGALLAFKVAAVALLWIWLTRASSVLTAAALGLIIGGAIGNAIDPLHWPGVMDFVLFHVDAGNWNFRWHGFNFAEPFGDFNLADVSIVVGVLALLYDSLRAGRAVKAP
jgi:signal peptidase II